jgi:Rps23 Pro-64 3,4-dihydroxylase Tpa1-like proline 4-hydroxylase
MSLFDTDHYRQLGQHHAAAYASAEPFPHIAIDDFLPTEILEQLLTEFPSADQIDWLRFEKHHSKKLATKGDKQFGPFTRQVMNEFSTAACLSFLETLTGITGLVPDPYFEGGGLHQIEPGGFLKIHADFNYHNKLRLDRRINLIVYLNKDWKDEYGGNLELWDRGMTKSVRKILPVYNRCVVFSTTDWSYHGHPEKLTCPPGRTRKSLALYYYSNGRPEEEKSTAHGTLWQERPTSTFRTTCANVLRGVAGVAESPGFLIRRAARVIGGRRAE